MLRVYICIYIFFFHPPLRVGARISRKKKKKKETFEGTILNINPLTILFSPKSNKSSNKSLINKLPTFPPFYLIFRNSIILLCFVFREKQRLLGENNG